MAEAILKQVNFNQSLKNIPPGGKKEYIMGLSHYVTRFMRHVDWQVYFHENGIIEEDRKETYGFPSQKCPPWKDNIPSQNLKNFKEEVAKLVGTIKFRPSKNNEFQQNIRKVVSKIEKNPHMLVSADKTSNFYEMKPEKYEKLVRDNITAKALHIFLVKMYCEVDVICCFAACFCCLLCRK